MGMKSRSAWLLLPALIVFLVSGCARVSGLAAGGRLPASPEGVTVAKNGLVVAIAEDKELSQRLTALVREIGWGGRFYSPEFQQSFWPSIVVIDIRDPRHPRWGEHHGHDFTYALAMPKLYVLGALWRQIEAGRHQLREIVTVDRPNTLASQAPFPGDPRPLLHPGELWTVGYLADLAITRSDNVAANVLIDLVGREQVTQFLRTELGFKGSDLTRKYLKRKYEDPPYRDAPPTMTCAAHAALFLYNVATDRLVSPRASRHIRGLLARQLDNGKFAAGLPPTARFAHKTGWWGDFTQDAGIVEDPANGAHYIIACLLPIAADACQPQLTRFARRLHAMMGK